MKIKMFFLFIWLRILWSFCSLICFVSSVSSRVAGFFKSMFIKKSKPCCEFKADNENKHKYKNLTIVFGNTVLCEVYDCRETYEGRATLKVVAIGPKVKNVDVGQIIVVDKCSYERLTGDIYVLCEISIELIVGE